MIEINFVNVADDVRAEIEAACDEDPHVESAIESVLGDFTAEDARNDGFVVRSVAGYIVAYLQDGWTVERTDSSVRDWVAQNAIYDDADFGEEMALWGFEEDPEEVNDDYAGDVKIWKKPNFYHGALGTGITAHYLRDGETNEELIMTLAEAKAFIENEESGVYLLANGEAGRPEYKIVAA